MKYNNGQKKKVAETLYMSGTHTFIEIADMMSLNEKTIRSWARAGNWEKIRASRAITPQRLLDDLYMLVNQIVDQINSRDDRISTSEEAMTISRLADAIKKMQTDVGIVEIVGVGMRFVNWARGVDLEKAKELAAMFDAFLKDQVK